MSKSLVIVSGSEDELALAVYDIRPLPADNYYCPQLYLRIHEALRDLLKFTD
jgi:hypothetical protein